MVTERIEVRVMAIAEGYAMVRRKRAVPFVCQVKELAEVTEQQEDSLKCIPQNRTIP
jgi:hypothetical protein